MWPLSGAWKPIKSTDMQGSQESTLHSYVTTIWSMKTYQIYWHARVSGVYPPLICDHYLEHENLSNLLTCKGLRSLPSTHMWPLSGADNPSNLLTCKGLRSLPSTHMWPLSGAWKPIKSTDMQGSQESTLHSYVTTLWSMITFQIYWHARVSGVYPPLICDHSLEQITYQIYWHARVSGVYPPLICDHSLEHDNLSNLLTCDFPSSSGSSLVREVSLEFEVHPAAEDMGYTYTIVAYQNVPREGGRNGIHTLDSRTEIVNQGHNLFTISGFGEKKGVNIKS